MGTEPLRAHVNESDSNENSDSENSGSCSYSSSSDSECGADGKSSAARNRRRNRNPAPQFSVTQSCHTGLKLKIAAVPRDPLSLTNKTQTKSANISEQTKVKVSPKKTVDTDTKKRSVKKKKKKSTLSESSTSSDSCSDCSGSRCSSDNEDLGTVARRAARQRSRLANKQAATSDKKSTTPTKSITTPTKNTTIPTKNANTPTKNATNTIKYAVTSNKNAVTTIKPAATVKEETIVNVAVLESKTKTVPNVKVSNVSAKTKTKSEESSPVKLSPAKSSPAKSSPAKSSPAKSSPAKSSPAKSSPVKPTPVKRGRGRPPAKLTSASASIGAEVSCVGAAAAFSSPSSTSSSSSSSSSSPSSSSSDSDSPDTAAGGSANGSSASDDSSAVLAAACSLQVIDEEDLAALLPEEPTPAPVAPPPFAPFAPPAEAEDDKSMDNGDGSSSEMELTPQLVSAAIQRATADSSDNECSNSGVTHSTATHYASSLLQEFVAQTQMLSSTAMTPISAPMDNVPLDQNVLSQINSLPEMNPITPNFLTTEHLSGQHLSPQQTEELSQINKDLEEIGAVTNSLPIHPPSLDSCVDNSDFMQIDISHTNSDLCSSDLLKSTQSINLPLLEIASTSGLNDSLKTDMAASSVDSQDETKSTTTERRRPGRPRKTPKVKKETDRLGCPTQAVKNNTLEPLNNVINEFCPNEPPNVSPDSGILSNHNSPAHSPLRKTIDHNPRIELLAKENEVLERRGRSRSQARRKTLKEETTLPTPKPQLAKPDKVKRIDHKLDIASLDRMLYATDRVLYPPRRKAGRPPQNKNLTKRGPGRPHKIASSIDSGDSDSEIRANRSVLSEVYAKRRDLNKLASLPKKGNRLPDNSWRDHQSDNEVGPDDPLDPTWRQIDLNPKYKDILSGYKSDHDVKPYKSCSRLIESGYKSDYGCRSGYKSDHRSGYKSDHRSGYKSDKGGYKTDHSVRSMRRRMRKLKKSRSVRDQSYYKNQKYFVSDQEILVLAKKTFSCLSLGQASDSEADSAPPIARDFVSASAKYKVLSARKHNNFINNSDPFAPAPVFSGFNARVSPSLGKFNLFQTLNSSSFSKTPFKPAHLNNLLSGSKSAFTHKFACPPMCTTTDKALSPGRKKDYLVNNNNIKSTRNNSPKHKKGIRNTENIFPMFSREKSPEVVTNVFEKARNIYIPNEELARNIFLNLKKTQKKVAISAKKPRKPFIIAPSKITLKPTCRLSRISPKLESRHHRHKTKRRHRRSRSVSRSRELIKPDDTVDQKFCQEVETLANHFLKLCHIAPKCTSQQSVKVADKAIPENAKCLKRVSKKRKVSDNTELATPSSKRRHKKQLADAQAKEPGANEHKLPLKKRHYHVNSCTSNPLSLSLVATGEKDEAQERSFLCTETDCMGTGDSHTKTKSSEKVTHDTEQMLKTIKSGISTTVESLTVQIDEVFEACISRYNSPNSVHSTDDETLIKKPTGEHSELSKKIYETSEKLKAVHKMVHDLEKSLPKNENCELVVKDSKIDSSKGETQKTIPTKLDTKNTSSSGTSSTKNVPIVTPKKRHRMESDKIVSNSSLDLVVQSLSRKLLDDKVSAVNSTPGSSPARHPDTVRTPDNKQSSDAPEPTRLPDPKVVSARTLCKASITPSHKSEIMTRKKNRLEGLTSNLVSKMNPSTATKVLDTLMNNNIRQSIESRIEKGKIEGLTDAAKVQDEKVKSGKDSGPINTRATVIKSPSTKSKPPDAKKQKNTDIICEQVVVVNIDKPTGIFEPSIDIEMQIPKSSISTMTLHTDKAELIGKNKHKLRSGDNKSNQKLTRPSLDSETEIPLSLIAKQIDGVLMRPKRSESIASVISDKIQETTGGHNLRHSKRNLTSDSEIHLMDDTNEKKKKKLTSNILRECKFVLPPQIMQAKVTVEKITLSDDINKTEVEKLAIKNGEIQTVDTSVDNAAPMKKKVKRRKVNRTGFPSLKKKKKKLPAQAVANPDLIPSSLPKTDTLSAFDRVPKHGETMHTFLERTATKKASEIKVPLNKDPCSRQGRLSVISLERLQGKNALDNNNIPVVKLTDIIKPGTPVHTASNTVANLNLNLFKGLVKTFSDSNAINKWEVLSETDSIPSMTPSSLGNDPEDSIPLSLLNLKPERPPSRLDRTDRLKRKTVERSASQELAEIALTKKVPVNKNIKRLRSKSSLGLYCPGDRRSTRSNDRLSLEAEDVGVKNLKTHIVNKKLLTNKFQNKILRPALLNQHRKSRTNQRKIRDCTPSSRESSLDTLKSIKLSPASRDTSVDTLRRSHCFENDPLPLQEKELDFEKSIDLLSKNVISKKRMASSRDDSPASSVERAKGTAPGKRNPRLRKKYLVAGLFSQYYKDDDPKPADPKVKASLNLWECPQGLLSPPPYCERWVRQRKQHFTLPYDVWWQHQYSQPVPSWNYRKIRTNVYYDVKPSSYGCESQACNCLPASGCQDDCINRMVYAECEAQHCPCKELCKNQRIQKHEWATGLEKFMTESKGWGVRSKESIPSGEFILEYVGEVVSDREFKERMASRYARDTHHYCLHLDGGLVIDGHRMGGDGRFVNHSCQPNCEMQKWSANGTFRMALFALRDIEPGEELTYDYNFSLFNPADGQVCKCESTNCRGVIGGKSQRVSRTATHKPSSRASSVASLHSSHSSTTSAQPQNQPITPSRVGRPRKAVKCNKKSESQRNICDLKSITLKYQQLHRLWQEPQMKPLSVKEKTIARQRHCFLLRNLEKVRRMKDRLPNLACAPLVPPPVPAAVAAPLHSRLRGRNKSARTPSTQHEPKQNGLDNVLRDIFNVLLQEKDEKKELICTSLLHCKSDKSKPNESAALVENTHCQDLSSIEAGLDSGRYKSVAVFDADICNVLSTAIKEFGRNSVQGLAALQLRKVYNSAKLEFAEQLIGILGPEETLPSGFLQKRKQEEVIMCICGLHFEEGLMVQCGGEVGGSAARGCGVWQHAHCMRVVDTTQPYLCHYCQPREVDLEIPMDEYTEDGHQFYLSLLRDSLQVRQGDTVYVLRDIPIDSTRPDRSQSTPSVSQTSQTPVEQVKRTERKKMKSLKESKGSDAKKIEERKSSSEVSKGGKEKQKDGVEVQKHTYKSIGDISVSELDIFRVERLWKHKETGERFVYGHHYLRPHETYHEPTRKFFQNEVMRVPLYEAVPIDLVMSQCWVMDVNTYCKGRPVGALEEHVYICELRVDRCARLFTKVSRPKYPVCTKSYAFDAFPQRLKISRTYAPHEVSPEFLKGRAKSQAQDKESKNSSKATSGTISAQKDGKEKKAAPFNPQLKRLQKPAHAQKQQREKLNGILLGLLAKLSQAGDDKALDVSYLLEGRRQRKKISS